MGAAPQAPHVATKQAKPTTKATTKKAAPKARKGAKAAKSAATKSAKPAAKATTAAAASKKALILEMLQRKGGATLNEIMQRTGCLAHSVRGAISTLGKKLGLRVESSKNESSERSYRIIAK